MVDRCSGSRRDYDGIVIGREELHRRVADELARRGANHYVVITGTDRLSLRSFVVRHVGQGAAYDFDGARIVLGASGAETGA